MKQRFPFWVSPFLLLVRQQGKTGRMARLGRPVLATVGSLALAGLLGSGCAGPGASSKAKESRWLVAVTDHPTQQWQPGKFVWHDLLTPNVSAARDFYGSLFGWTFEAEGPYTVIRNQGRKIGGMVEVKPTDEQPAQALWLGSLSVADVDEAVTFLKKEGGTLLSGPEEMAQRGRGALVSDPQGAQLLLLRSATGDPPDRPAALGDWLWNEIWTGAPADTVAFYQALAGYDSLIEADRYTVLVKNDKWRAGVRHVFREGFRTRWVPVVRVLDPAAIIEQVPKLGGRVWVRPSDPASNGDTALISDPTGAFLVVQRWNW